MKFNKINIFISLLALVIICSSCQNDDEPDVCCTGSGQEYAAKAILKIDGKYITGIEDFKINYDAEGRLSSYTNDRYGLIFNIDYTNNYLSSNEPYENGMITFNEMGYISEICNSKVNNDENYIEEEELLMKFEYNSDGCLTSFSVYSKDTDIDKEDNEKEEQSISYLVTLNWKNNNIESVFISWKEDFYGDKSSGTEKFYITYGTQKNEYRQFPYVLSWAFLDYATDWSFSTPIFAAVGLHGKGPINLPYELYNEWSDGHDAYETFSFDLNPNGSIASEDWGIQYQYGNNEPKMSSHSISYFNKPHKNSSLKRIKKK